MQLILSTYVIYQSYSGIYSIVFGIYYYQAIIYHDCICVIIIITFDDVYVHIAIIIISMILIYTYDCIYVYDTYYVAYASWIYIFTHTHARGRERTGLWTMDYGEEPFGSWTAIENKWL